MAHHFVGGFDTGLIGAVRRREIVPRARLSGKKESSIQRRERHTRLLAPLTFLSPRIIAAIIEAPPYSWAEQKERNGFSL